MKSQTQEIMEPIDLSPLFAKYKGLWVALTDYTPDYKVICTGRKPETVFKKAIEKGYKTPVVFKLSSELSNAIL